MSEQVTTASGSIGDDRKHNPLSLREGEIDPRLNKVVRELILTSRTYAVYLDEELDVYWWYQGQAEPKGFGTVLLKVAALESMPMGFLSAGNQAAFRRQIGESLARALDEGTSENALASLDNAANFFKARSDETARRWYLICAITYFGAAAISLTCLRACGFRPTSSMVSSTLYAAGLGALGSCLFMMSRMKSFAVEPAAGRELYWLESAARVTVGMIGSFLMLLALKAGWILEPLMTGPKGVFLWLALCLVAGASERLVPNLIGSFERAGTNDKQEDAKK